MIIPPPNTPPEQRGEYGLNTGHETTPTYDQYDDIPKKNVLKIVNTFTLLYNFYIFAPDFREKGTKEINRKGNT